ncbi:MAG: cysteine peptidase family C39 domain-containing protein [Planctomycetota bacterium]|jgi:hypothetical protein
MRRFASPALLILLVAAAGCHPLASTRTEEALLADGYVVVEGLRVPEVEGNAGCGAQALAAVMAHGDPARDPVALGAELPWHDVGATPVDLLLAARNDGFEARVEAGTVERLVEEASAGRPAVVMLDVAPVWPSLLLGAIPLGTAMHWAVVTGIGDDGARILLGAPDGRHHVVDGADFQARWERADRCLIVVTPAR